MFDVHWWYRTSCAPLLRLTSLNVFNVTKIYGNIITMSAIELITLLKIQSEMKGMQENNLSCVRGR